MTTKKIQSTRKAAKKAPAKKTKSTVAKKTSAPVLKNAKDTEPYSPVFGVILLIVCVIIAVALLVAATRL